MSGPTPTGPGGIAIPPPEEPDEPMAADKRTIVIAVVVMVSLVLVGVVSAALFATSACEAIEPVAVEAGSAGAHQREVLLEVVDDTTEASVVDAMDAALTALADELGPLTGLADVGVADTLTLGSTGPTATGATTTLLAPDGANVVAAADTADATVVGSADTLYALAITNELTGQVDAFQPLDPQLEGLTCVDTATVGTPLAFHVGAADGHLVLLRVDEDGDDPVLERRDPVQGSVWTAPIETGVAPAGLVGERLTGSLGPDAVVVGHRTEPETEVPVLTAVDLVDGEPRWVLDRDELGATMSPDVPEHVDVVAVDEDVVLVAIEPEVGEDEAGEAAASDVARSSVGGRLLALDAADGAVRWEAVLDDDQRVYDVALADGEAWLALGDGREAGGIGLARVGPEGLAPALGSPEATRGRVAVADDGTAVAVTDDSVLTDRTGELVALAGVLVGLDAVADGGAVTLLLGLPDADGRAVAATFGG